jgi:hypothetical protein
MGTLSPPPGPQTITAPRGIKDWIGIIILVGVSSLTVVSCKPSMTQVQGDVFIVTRGSQNIKLGLVTVSAIPASAMAAHLDNGKKGLGKAAAERLEAIRILTASVTAEAARHREERDRIKESTWENFGNRDSLLQRAEEEETAAQLLEARVKEIQGSTTEGLYVYLFEFSNLPPAVATAKTDADGRFVLTLPRGQGYFFIATAKRRLIDSEEEYRWAVPVKAEDLGKGRVFLSNDNLVEAMYGPTLARQPRAARPTRQWPTREEINGV